MGDAERIQRRWLETAAAILQEMDPLAGRERLECELLLTFRARMGVQAPLRPTSGRQGVRVFGDFELPSPAHWALALERAETDHPMFSYQIATADPEPVTLLGVMRRGWQLSGFAAGLIEELGLSRHQLSLPLATVGPQAGTFGFVADHEYREADLQIAALIQPVVRGLEVHLELLGSLAPAERGGGPVRPLTGREQVVLALVAQGCTASAIAARLQVSPRTVHKHQENLYRKLDAVDRLSAVLRAQEYGLLPRQPGSAERPWDHPAGSSQTPAVSAACSAASVPAKTSSM